MSDHETEDLESKATEVFSQEVESRNGSVKSRDGKSLSRRSSVKSESSEGTGDGSEFVVPRTIGLLGGISFIVGTIIGSGIFVSPAGVAEGSGSVGLTMINWVICGIISMFGAFAYAELGTVIKDSGADYSYLHYGFGPIISYMYSWVNNLLVKPASLALIALTCAQYIVTPIFDDGCGEAPEYIKKILAIVVLFILGAVNVYSVKLAERVQIIFTVSKLIALAIIIIGGIVKLAEGYTDELAKGFQNSETNPGKIAVGLYSGMWAYDGWNTANFMTEEIINPSRNLPLAIIIGVPLVIVLYVMTNISYFTVMSVEEIIASPAVALTWADRVLPSVSWLIPLFVALSTFGTGNGSLFSSVRLMYASARNEHMPEFLAMVHVKKYTPVSAIVLTIILAIIFLIPGNIGSLIDFVSFLLWIFYGMAIITVVIFRFRKQYRDLDRSFKVPLIIPIIAFLASVFIVVVPLVTDPQIEFLFAVILIVIGYIVYVPLVHFKVRFGFMRSVTKFFQLYFQAVKPGKEAIH